MINQMTEEMAIARAQRLGSHRLQVTTSGIEAAEAFAISCQEKPDVIALACLAAHIKNCQEN
jgi:hypothetical protein